MLGAHAVLLTGGCDLNLRPGARSILEALYHEPTPTELALMATDPYDANNRALGTLGLASMPFANEPVYVRLFEQNFEDPDPAVRLAAIRGLALHGDPTHLPLLVRALSDDESLVRLEAARGLQRLHHPEAIEPLLTAVREPDPRRPNLPAEPQPEVRAAAAYALGQYAERRVVLALIAALNDSDLTVANNARQALRTLTGQDLGPDHAAWTDWSTRTDDLFAARGAYVCKVFRRPLRFYEYFPFVPRPRNEVPGPPAGMPLDQP